MITISLINHYIRANLVETNFPRGTTNQKPLTTQIWVVTRHQYAISALVSQASFGVEASDGVAKCRLFSQATLKPPYCFTLLKSDHLEKAFSWKSTAQ